MTDSGESSSQASNPSFRNADVTLSPHGYKSQLDNDHFDQEIMSRPSQLEMLKELISYRRSLVTRNLELQFKVVDLSRKKGEEYMDSPVVSEEQLKEYERILESIHRSNQELESSRELSHKEVEDLQKKLDNLEAKGLAEREELNHLIQSTSRQAVYSQSGRPIDQQELELLLSLDSRLQAEERKINREAMKINRMVAHLERALKNSELLPAGLTLVEHEQLKVENQTYSEEIEEKQENISQAKQKLARMVETLTHLKEKLYITRLENDQRRKVVDQLDADLTQSRNQLNRLKRLRERNRAEVDRLRNQLGLLGRRELLADMERTLAEEVNLVQRIGALRTSVSPGSSSSSASTGPPDAPRKAANRPSPM